MRIAIVYITAYLLGSIPFGYLIVRARSGADIRETGSGGTGATNVSRRAGKAAGVLTLVLDALKGAAAIWIARLILDSGNYYVKWRFRILGDRGGRNPGHRWTYVSDLAGISWWQGSRNRSWSVPCAGADCGPGRRSSVSAGGVRDPLRLIGINHSGVDNSPICLAATWTD